MWVVYWTEVDLDDSSKVHNLRREFEERLAALAVANERQRVMRYFGHEAEPRVEWED